MWVSTAKWSSIPLLGVRRINVLEAIHFAIGNRLGFLRGGCER